MPFAKKVNSIFSRDLTNVNSHSVTYGHIVYKNESAKEVVDYRSAIWRGYNLVKENFNSKFIKLLL